jgi:hypothetical protein
MIDDGALVRRLGVLTETLHAVFYFAPEATAAYESVGLRGYWRGYFASRCAALGPVGPELATALLGGFAPSMVARALPMVWKLANPEDAVTARTSAATAALRRLVGDDLEPVAAAGAADGRSAGRPAPSHRSPGRALARHHRAAENTGETVTSSPSRPPASPGLSRTCCSARESTRPSSCTAGGPTPSGPLRPNECAAATRGSSTQSPIGWRPRRTPHLPWPSDWS